MEYSSHIPLKLKDAQRGVRLSVIKRHNQALLELSVLTLLKDLKEAYDVTWSPDAELKVIDSIISIYWHLTIDEIAHVFRNGIDGVYKVYGKLLPTTVMQWIEAYDTERTDFYVGNAQAQNDGYEKQFRETEKKDAQRINELRKKAIEQQKAYKEAKQVIKNQE